MNQQKESTEKDWLDAVERVFRQAKSQVPAVITHSEIESLIIGLRSLAKSQKGVSVLNMLQKYMDFMVFKRRYSMKLVEGKNFK